MNQQQSNILERVIKSKIAERKSDLEGRKTEELDRMKDANKPKAKELAKKMKELKSKVEAIDEELAQLGYSYDNYDEDLSTSSSYKWEENKKVAEKYAKIEKSLTALELKLTAKVYGATGDFDKMMGEIEKELNNF